MLGQAPQVLLTKVERNHASVQASGLRVERVKSRVQGPHQRTEP